MKNIPRRIIAVIYIGVMLVGLFITIKPEASIFYLKKSLDNQAVTLDSGYAYRSEFNVNRHLFRLKDSLVYENGQPLLRTEDSIVFNVGEGSYSISEDQQGKTMLYFSTSDNSSPLTNGRTYSLAIPTTFLSRITGMSLLVILLPALFGFFYYTLLIPENRKSLQRSPLAILDILDRFLESASKINRGDEGTTKQQVKARLPAWKMLFSITILVVYIYTFMEWFFFLTKPSFMSMMGFPEKMGILLISGLFYCLLCMVIIAIYIFLDVVAIGLHLAVLTRYLIAVLPAFIISVLALLMLDNFTYTVFKFGISTSTGVWRGIYALLFLFIYAYSYFQMLKFFFLWGEGKSGQQLSNRWFYLSVCLLVIAAATALIKLDLNQLASARTGTGSGTSSSHPNIIILGTDGLNADNMTIYGYERDTTPRIAELAQDSLVAENNFPNSSNSAGSVVSMLTSKLPTETHLVYAPDILTGANAYQHLPGVLKMAGYRAVEFGMPDYVDAYSFNMQYSFDEVNGISEGHTQISTYLQKLGYDNTDYFLNKLMGRVSERLKHIFYLEDMQNPYNIVTQRARGISDQEKITQMLEVIEQSPEPVFAHLHLLGTHGAKFYPPIQEFSQGKQQDQGWMVDFYDDAVLSFDSYVGQVIDGLIKNGEYDNTILIINSDHAMQYRVNKRIPLIMHFPDDESAGRISQNVQNLDIAPTILDYLGMPVPEWMGGKSILQGNIDHHRPIISAGTVKVTEDAQGLFTLDSQQVKPPFYQFSMVNVIDCQRWYQLDLTGLQWLSGEVENYVEPCVEDSMLSFDEIKQLVAQQLLQDGFDVSSLP